MYHSGGHMIWLSSFASTLTTKVKRISAASLPQLNKEEIKVVSCLEFRKWKGTWNRVNNLRMKKIMCCLTWMMFKLIQIFQQMLSHLDNNLAKLLKVSSAVAPCAGCTNL